MNVQKGLKKCDLLKDTTNGDRQWLFGHLISNRLTTAQLCPRFNQLLICDFMAQFLYIIFHKTCLVLFQVLYFQSNAQAF